jgi:hypothetical protein
MGNIVELFHVEHIVITCWLYGSVMTTAPLSTAKLRTFLANCRLLSAKACRRYRVKFARLLQRAVAVIVDFFNSYGDGLLPILFLPTACRPGV